MTTDPRTIPGGATGYVGQWTNNLPAYEAAGKPYNDLNNYQLTNAGAWTGNMADGSTPIPVAPVQQNPYSWNASLFAAANGWWWGFNTVNPVSQNFTLASGSYALLWNSQGQGNITVELEGGGEELAANGDTFSIDSSTACTITVTGNGAVQLAKR